MALPASLQHGAILSLGCMSNRVYTDLGEDEMYFVLRGKDLAAVAESLATITPLLTTTLKARAHSWRRFSRGRRLHTSCRPRIQPARREV